MADLSRRTFIVLSSLSAVFPFSGRMVSPAQASAPVLEVYKSPYCGCCGVWVNHMRKAGFSVKVTNMEDLEPIKTRFGVSRDLQSCHTGIVEKYVIEGHVPAADVMRLLQERPTATGLAVPGMPIGSPGMEQGSRKDPYEVILFSRTERDVFARH
jgi:hypothetical protein